MMSDLYWRRLKARRLRFSDDQSASAQSIEHEIDDVFIESRREIPIQHNIGASNITHSSFMELEDSPPDHSSLRRSTRFLSGLILSQQEGILTLIRSLGIINEVDLESGIKEPLTNLLRTQSC